MAVRTENRTVNTDERDSWCERDAELVLGGGTTRDRQRQRETRGVSAMLNSCAVVARLETETERDSWCERDAELVRGGGTTRDRQRKRETRGVSAMLNSSSVVTRRETDRERLVV